MVKLAEQANSSYSLIVKRESFLGPNFMSEIRFIAKGGQSVDGAIVCQRFFEVAITSGLKPDHASRVARCDARRCSCLRANRRHVRHRDP